MLSVEALSLELKQREEILVLIEGALRFMLDMNLSPHRGMVYMLLHLFGYKCWILGIDGFAVIWIGFVMSR